MTSFKIQNILELIVSAQAKQQFINRWNIIKNTDKSEIFLDNVLN